MLLPQTFLLSHTLNDLIKDHGVYFSPSLDKRKVSLNYSQIEAKDNDPLAKQCRGLILSKTDHSQFNENEIVGETFIQAYPFNRFFNYGQACADTINWKDPNLKVLEKVDGTCIICYFDKIKLEWHVATRAVPEAHLNINGFDFSFRQLFEKATNFKSLTENHNKNYTYIYELTSPFNRIVVDYPNTSITLLGIRDNISLNELEIDDYDLKVKSFSINSIDNILELINSFPPSQMEGVVVKDSNFNRVKVKSMSYVAAHHLKDSATSSTRNMLKIILDNKDDDVITFLPEELKHYMLRLKEGLRVLAIKYDKIYLELKNTTGSRKEFAIAVDSSGYWHSPLFNMYSGKSNTFMEFVLGNNLTNSFLDTLLEKINIS
jgi:hypothetical protein